MATTKDGKWILTCEDDAQKAGDYAVPISNLLKSPEAFIDWMAHLTAKPWFEPQEFADFFVRLRRELDSPSRTAQPTPPPSEIESKDN